MAKNNQIKTFAKYEILKAADLNNELKNAGSIGGLIPYNETTKAKDTTMGLDIGSKDYPFGNVFAKGINVYTEAEINTYVSAGKITSADRLMFLDPNDNNVKIWNGSSIVSISATAGIKAMQTSGNSWSKEYSNGWVEQGGRISWGSGSASYSIQLPLLIPLASVYSVTLTETNMPDGRATTTLITSISGGTVTVQAGATASHAGISLFKVEGFKA